MATAGAVDLATFLGYVVSELGAPYVFGGDSPQQGFDCSGLVQWGAGKVGISVPRGATDQLHALPVTTTPTSGDLVFFNTGDGWEAGHVGICAAPGCAVMIDAPHTGSTVGIHSVEGYGTIVGYRSLPGPASKTGRGMSVDQLQHDATSGGISGSIDTPLGTIGTDDLSNLDPVQAVLDLLAQFPAELVKLLTGGHTVTELTLRALEILAGGLLLAVGGVTFVLVIAERGEAGRSVRGTRRAGRTVTRPLRSAGAEARRLTAVEPAPRARTREGRRELDRRLADRERGT